MICDGYVVVKEPSHPRANSNGYVYFHLLVAEKALGKPLPPGALVHHLNGDKSDNRNSNLVICPSAAYHKFLHRRMDEKQRKNTLGYLFNEDYTKEAIREHGGLENVAQLIGVSVRTLYRLIGNYSRKNKLQSALLFHLGKKPEELGYFVKAPSDSESQSSAA